MRASGRSSSAASARVPAQSAFEARSRRRDAGARGSPGFAARDVDAKRSSGFGGSGFDVSRRSHEAARVLVPRASVRARSFQRLEVAALRRERARPLVKRASRGAPETPPTRTSARPTGSRARAAARARSLFENEDRTRGDQTTARAFDPARLARGTRAHSPRTHVRGDDGQYAAPGRRRHAAARVEGARRRRRRRLLSVNNMEEATDASARLATRATTTSPPRTSTRVHLSNRHPHARWFAAGTR